MSAGLARLPAQAYVYAIGASDGPQKIGVAGSPGKRLAILQIGSHQVFSVSFAVEVLRDEAYGVEAIAHRLLADKHIRGEWFDVSPQAARDAVAEYRSGSRCAEAVEWEKLLVRFSVGTAARFDRVKKPGEDRATLLRELLDKELRRRERTTHPAAPPSDDDTQGGA